MSLVNSIICPIISSLLAEKLVLQEESPPPYRDLMQARKKRHE